MPYIGVYWNDSIPTIIGYIKNDIKDKKSLILKAGTKVTVQFDDKEISTNIRCKVNEDERYFVDINNLILSDSKLYEQIKENRKPLIKRGLINAIIGFD